MKDDVEAGSGFVITIDGPAGTGKSATAHRLAERLRLTVLDTGAMYRAAVVIALEAGLAMDDGAGIAAAVERVGIRFDFSRQPPGVLAGDLDVTERIRGAKVSSLVSPVSALPALRRVLVAAQRQVAREHHGLVTEGRDQGTVVFPDAPVKIYLDAAPAVRAARRARQLREAGRAEVDEARILADIQERDQRDSTRAESPLRCPEDAYRLDTSALSLEEVVDELERIARESLPGPPADGTGEEAHEQSS
ncbi:MAG: (d)CMP kinase [Phycisphaerales bacterium JB038]